MPKIFTSKTQKTGEIGETLAARYLTDKGFRIIERNYTKKWGELDIVAEKGSRLHFVEVKAKTVSNFDARIDAYRPEDGMHMWKQQRLKRVIQTYLLERRVRGEWQFDLLTVYLNPLERKANVKFSEDIIL